MKTSLQSIRWNIRHHGPLERTLVEQILINREIHDDDHIARFIKPSFETHLHDPSKLTDLDQAVQILEGAVRSQKRILVFGDYDADGVTATALMVSFLLRVNANVDYFLPHRINDGYGLTIGGVDIARERGADLIVTVDNGIVANAAVDHANTLGIDVIITDHHRAGDQLPNAAAIVNPNRPDCAYPFKGISGVGVAFKLIYRLSEKLMTEADREHFLRWNLDLVAMGTVADMMPIRDENRVIVHYGLKVISKSQRLGIRALLRSLQQDGKQADAMTIGFQLGPRINAAGRLEKADKALELLLTENPQRAEALAEELNQVNQTRRLMTDSAVENAMSEIVGDPKIIILQGDWHPGIIGLIAARIQEKLYRPTLIFSRQTGSDELKASGRSPKTVDITRLMMAAESVILNGGGHRQACGCSIKADDFETFKSLVEAATDKTVQDDDLVRELDIEAELPAQLLRLDTIDHVDQLAPFGNEFPQPSFFSVDLPVTRVKSVGKDQAHLQLYVKPNGTEIGAIGFRMGHLAEHIRKDQQIDIAYELQRNEWNGRISPQLLIRDIRV